MSPSKYVHEAVRNCEMNLAANNSKRYKLHKKVENPFVMRYDPKMDMNTELEPDSASHFQPIIVFLKWIVELGRVDITMKISLLLSHLALLREGQLEAAVHIMAYLRQKYHCTLAYDPTYPEVDHSIFKKCDWTEFYWNARVVIPINKVEPTASTFLWTLIMQEMRDFVDQGVAASSRFTLSQYIIIHRKGFFWSEFMAMKQSIDALRCI